MSLRIERDPLGELQVPADAYYGVQTARAVENFPISGLRAPADLVTATILIKKAAADVNAVLGRLDAEVARAIVAAADEILSGKLRDQFVVDVYQAGAGTSHNMNANEVLANRAAEILGDARGTYKRVHPNDHVNMGQSTNDVFPTATRLALLIGAGPLVAAARWQTAWHARATSSWTCSRPGARICRTRCRSPLGRSSAATRNACGAALRMSRRAPSSSRN